MSLNYMKKRIDMPKGGEKRHKLYEVDDALNRKDIGDLVITDVTLLDVESQFIFLSNNLSS